MKTAIVIPSRYGATRLPAKPLLRETGKYMVQHVYEQACKAKADSVVVATDDQRIFDAVKSFGGQAVMTRPDHATGTDRIAEVARGLKADIIVNLQGDEPMMDPAGIDLLPELFKRDPEASVATVAAPITSLADYQDPACVKVVCDSRGRALYFSRSPIPHVREGQPDFARKPPLFLQHLGLYAYRREFLLKFAELTPTPLEDYERLEQLRVLAAGKIITVGLVKHACRGIDTPADYQRFVETWRKLQGNKAA